MSRLFISTSMLRNIRLYIFTLFCINLSVHCSDFGNFKMTQLKGSTAIPAICSSECQANINNTELATFCSNSSLKLQDRCCVNITGHDQFIIIGIDLQQCNMNQTQFCGGIDGINTLQYIYLQGNNISALNNTDFHRNTDIVILSIPPNVECPGGERAWANIETNTTVRTCQREINPCLAENLTCPTNSHCVHSGIDLTECLCDDDYHGYKCMNKGEFPTVPFSIGISASTLLACLFLWCTQRRYVKSEFKKK